MKNIKLFIIAFTLFLSVFFLWKVFWQEEMNLTEEQLNNINQNIQHIEIIDNLYKKQQKPKVSLIFDKSIQEEFYWNKILLHLNNKEYFVWNDTLVTFILEQADFYNFLQDKNFSFTIFNEDSKIKVDYTPFKNLAQTKKLLINYKLFMKKNWEWYTISVLDQETNWNTDWNTTWVKEESDIKITVTNYQNTEEKLVPWFWWYTNTIQLFIWILLPIDIAILVFSFWFWYKKLRKTS